MSWFSGWVPVLVDSSIVVVVVTIFLASVPWFGVVGIIIFVFGGELFAFPAVTRLHGAVKQDTKYSHAVTLL